MRLETDIAYPTDTPTLNQLRGYYRQVTGLPPKRSLMGKVLGDPEIAKAIARFDTEAESATVPNYKATFDSRRRADWVALTKALNFLASAQSQENEDAQPLAIKSNIA